MTLFFILYLSALFVVGFAYSGEADFVTVNLKSSYTIGGVTYHPNSSGVKMLRSHAKAIDAEIVTQPEPEDESEKEGLQLDEAAEQGLPDDFPERELLLSVGLDTKQKVSDYPDLTSIKGIGKATEKKIIEAL